MQNVHEGSSTRQEHPQSTAEALDSLIADLYVIRARALSGGRRRRSGILAGQFLILAKQYREGPRPSQKTLKNFFRFVVREREAA